MHQLFYLTCSSLTQKHIQYLNTSSHIAFNICPLINITKLGVTYPKLNNVKTRSIEFGWGCLISNLSLNLVALSIPYDIVFNDARGTKVFLQVIHKSNGSVSTWCRWRFSNIRIVLRMYNPIACDEGKCVLICHISSCINFKIKWLCASVELKPRVQ
jgi:hypothetical protein